MSVSLTLAASTTRCTNHSISKTRQATLSRGQTEDRTGQDSQKHSQANGGRWKNRRTKLSRCISPGDSTSYLHRPSTFSTAPKQWV